MKKLLSIFLLVPIMTFAAGKTVPSIKDIPLPKIEESYWICDYASTQIALTANDAVSCSIIYEELKLRKFGGDYLKFNEWWKANKAAEHAKIAKKG